MAGQRLLTLLHISDLHLGDLDAEKGDNSPDALTCSYWKVSRWFDGFLGHTWRALRALSELYADLGEKLVPGEKLRVIASGDLTTTGRGPQFATADEFLHGHLYFQGSILGLGADPGDCVVIPGNHDRWPGRRFMLFGGPTSEFAKAFPSTYPRSKVTFELGSGCNLRIAEIDSDDETRGPLKKLLAQGSFVQQCRQLKLQLRTPSAEELRVLVIHHSSIDRQPSSSTLKIDPESLEALRDLVATTGIRIVLSGHWHYYDFRSRVSGDIPEARCGTTTVHDYFNGQRLYPNCALVHRVTDEGGALRWSTEVWLRPIIFEADGQVPGFSRFEYQETIDFGLVWP
jgi:hypothetical protein